MNTPAANLEHAKFGQDRSVVYWLKSNTELISIDTKTLKIKKSYSNFINMRKIIFLICLADLEKMIDF